MSWGKKRQFHESALPSIPLSILMSFVQLFKTRGNEGMLSNLVSQD